MCIVEKLCGFQKEVLRAIVRIRIASRDILPDGLLTKGVFLQCFPGKTERYGCAGYMEHLFWKQGP